MKRYTNAQKNAVVLFSLAAFYANVKDVEFQQGVTDVEKLKSCLLVLDDIFFSNSILKEIKKFHSNFTCICN